MSDPNFVLTESLDVDHEMVGGKIRANGTLTGSGAPVSIPPSQKAWIYVDTVTGEAYVWDASGAGEWLPFAGTTAEPGDGWSLDGNTGAAGAKLGTTDANDLSLVTNNAERVSIAPTGEVTIGSGGVGDAAFASVYPAGRNAMIGVGSNVTGESGGYLDFNRWNTGTEVHLTTVEQGAPADPPLGPPTVGAAELHMLSRENPPGGGAESGFSLKAASGVVVTQAASISASSHGMYNTVNIHATSVEDGLGGIANISLASSPATGATGVILAASDYGEETDSRLAFTASGVSHWPRCVGEGTDLGDPDSLEVYVPVTLPAVGLSEAGVYLRRATLSFVVDPLVPELRLMAGAPFAAGTQRVASVPLTLDAVSGNYFITAP